MKLSIHLTHLACAAACLMVGYFSYLLNFETAMAVCAFVGIGFIGVGLYEGTIL